MILHTENIPLPLMDIQNLPTYTNKKEVENESFNTMMNISSSTSDHPINMLKDNHPIYDNIINIIQIPLPEASSTLMDMSLPIKAEYCTIRTASGKVKMICEIEECTKVAQSRKRCKLHGGGPRCRHEGCTKSSQGKGRCRAHGGGKQCQAENCKSGAQQRGLCSRHGKQYSKYYY